MILGPNFHILLFLLLLLSFHWCCCFWFWHFLIILVIITIIIITIIFELTYSETVLEITVDIEPQERTSFQEPFSIF